MYLIETCFALLFVCIDKDVNILVTIMSSLLPKDIRFSFILLVFFNILFLHLFNL